MPEFPMPVNFVDNANNIVMSFTSNPNTITVGGKGHPGVITVADNSGICFVINGNNHSMVFRLPPKSGQVIGDTVFHFDADNASITVGSDGVQRLLIDGSRANIFLGGNNQDGDIVLYPSDVLYSSGVANVPGREASTIHLSAQTAEGGTIILRSKGKETIRIDGASGDIVLQNADCAEDFEIDAGAEVEPGSVLVVAEAGRLCLADRPYDRRVAGVVSGAGGLRPGLVLGRRSTGGAAIPIGLAGRVFCKVDATHHPVDAGDLLTTSAIPGHAMAAIDPARAFGSVLGKALQPLAGGQALIPILVSLQ